MINPTELVDCYKMLSMFFAKLFYLHLISANGQTVVAPK